MFLTFSFLYSQLYAERESGVVVEGSRRLKIRNDKMTTTKTIASTAVFFVKPHARKHIICQSSPISSLAGQKKLTRNGDPYPFYDDGAIREGEGTFLSNTQKIYMAEWHAVASLVFGITIPFIVVEWSEPKAKKSAYSC